MGGSKELHSSHTTEASSKLVWFGRCPPRRPRRSATAPRGRWQRWRGSSHACSHIVMTGKRGDDGPAATYSPSTNTDSEARVGARSLIFKAELGDPAATVTGTWALGGRAGRIKCVLIGSNSTERLCDMQMRTPLSPSHCRHVCAYIKYSEQRQRAVLAVATQIWSPWLPSWEKSKKETTRRREGEKKNQTNGQMY